MTGEGQAECRETSQAAVLRVQAWARAVVEEESKGDDGVQEILMRRESGAVGLTGHKGRGRGSSQESDLTEKRKAGAGAARLGHLRGNVR